MTQFDSQFKRLIAARLFGGSSQKDRMIADKRKTLDRVTLYSYQGDNIRKLGDNKTVKGLINPSKLTSDYDDKTLSVRYEHDFVVGDVFEWEDTNTHWLIYLQDITELSYFRGDIRRCQYQVSWLDKDKNRKSSYLAVRGPVETTIQTIQQPHTTIDVPNYSLNILMPCNEDTFAYFQRYAKFYLQDSKVRTCWQVETVNAISTPGILEITAKEDYSNPFIDDVANGIVDGLIEEPQDPTPDTLIKGETFIKAKGTYSYEFMGEGVPNWSYNKKLPIKEISQQGNVITLCWDSNFRGEFDLECNSTLKTIVVDSLF